MRINLISFLDPRIYHGGGEMISEGLLKVGMERGHDIRIASARPHSIDAIHANPELTFLIDIHNHGHTYKSLGAWRGFNSEWINTQLAKAPFIHMTNAYVDVCNLPYLPCSGYPQGSTCPSKPLPIPKKILFKDSSASCFAKKTDVRRLYTDPILNIYLSPLHKKISEGLIGEGVAPGYVLKPMIDTSRFQNHGLERDIEYLFVGIIGEAKGYSEIRRRFASSNIYLIGKTAPGIEIDFGRHLGHVPYNEVPKYMNRAKNFVFLPRWPEPQGRVVTEAALCGCRIVGNDNVGALSFDFDLSDPTQYVGVEDSFWAHIETLI